MSWMVVGIHPLPLDRLYPWRKGQPSLESGCPTLDVVKLSTLFDDEGKAASVAISLGDHGAEMRTSCQRRAIILDKTS